MNMSGIGSTMVTRNRKNNYWMNLLLFLIYLFPCIVPGGGKTYFDAESEGMISSPWDSISSVQANQQTGISDTYIVGFDQQVDQRVNQRAIGNNNQQTGISDTYIVGFDQQVDQRVNQRAIGNNNPPTGISDTYIVGFDQQVDQRVNQRAIGNNNQQTGISDT